MNFSDYVYYDETSPTYLRWSSNRQDSYRDKRAGSLNMRGNEKDYVRVWIGGKQLPIARVIWSLFNGEIPTGMVIDHLDGDKWNNSISNLALKTPKTNTQNLRTRSDNKSGIPGICIKRQVKGKYVYNYIFAYAGVGKDSTKVFSIDKLGFNDALTLAVNWRLERIAELNSSGDDYTTRHILECLKVKEGE